MKVPPLYVHDNCRGSWSPDTHYYRNDRVILDDGHKAYARAEHRSGPSLDSGLWAAQPQPVPPTPEPGGLGRWLTRLTTLFRPLA